MRLLHTSDWHVGRTIRGRSRAHEFETALGEVVGIAVQEDVDAVLVAGDLYARDVALRAWRGSRAAGGGSSWPEAGQSRFRLDPR